MTRDDLRRILAEALGEIAPEAPLDQLEADAPLREELDLDSMDFLNFVVALHEKLGVDIPERDYAHFQTLRGALDYLEPLDPAGERSET